MHTPLTTHTFSTDGTASADSMESRLVTPAVIVAGSRVSREVVRLVVAAAFFALEAILQLGEWRGMRLRGRKRQA